jgi:hypothetical protein
MSQIIENDVVGFDIDEGKPRISDLGLDDVVLAFLIDDGTLDIAVQEIERVHLVPLKVNRSRLK